MTQTQLNKLTAIQSAVRFAKFRQAQEFKEAKRTALQAAAEVGTGLVQRIVFTVEDMKTIAEMTGGTYQAVKGPSGDSRISFA